MGKYLGYALGILLVLCILEFFQIVDIPFLEIPDFTGGKEELVEKADASLKQRFGD